MSVRRTLTMWIPKSEPPEPWKDSRRIPPGAPPAGDGRHWLGGADGAGAGARGGPPPVPRLWGGGGGFEGVTRPPRGAGPKCGPAVRGIVRAAAVVVGHERRAARHRLHGRHPEPLVPRRAEEDPAAAVEPGEPALGEVLVVLVVGLPH